MRAVNSAFQAKLQQDASQIAELIDLETATASFRWTTSNLPIFATLSGTVHQYDPFPGGNAQGIEESSDLGVAVIDFIMANTGDLFSKLMVGGDFSLSSMSISRVFVDTPDLDRMYIYVGQIGDYTYDRVKIHGQARNVWGSLAPRFPYYVFADTCQWRFGSQGCGFDTSTITLHVGTSHIEVGSSTTLTIKLTSGTLSASFDTGRFDYGRVTITGGVNSGQVRTIRQQIGDYVGLSHALSLNNFVGLQLDIFPGCRKRLTEDCTSLYNNPENFLGFPWIPVQEDVLF